ncbi:hypothetical protein [Magnetospirillum molischianum]|uniref:Glycosyltransferase RgtA/B/C/D-like domain-containing protein n=1 Tax=Magnetospirillum molischianum DSM 120 TaxID=1150626 RepID=H8FXG0_MAGML|nr:hypothetical protein [Magnetospirillum molischianum]CCG43048.1 membrane hypothetical protein [Magnetospirillum molischianum DSM 120]
MAIEKIRTSAFAIIIAGISYALLQIIFLPDAPILEPDSASYLAFSPIRTATYPLLLRAMGSDIMVIIQPLFYAIATIAISLYCLTISRHPLPALAIMVGLLINPEVNNHHSRIMTESLFMTCLLVFLIAVMAFFRSPGWRLAFVTGILAGLAATIRPSGYALCPVLVVMVLMARKQLAATPVFVILLAAVMPMLVVVGGERAYTSWVQGDQATSLMGRHLLAKSIMIDVPRRESETDPVRQQFLNAAENTFEPIRTLLKQAPNQDILSPLSQNYETCLEYACIAPVRAEIDLSEQKINAIALSVAIERLSAAPLSYGKLVWLNYRAMWALYPQTHPWLAPDFRTFVIQHRPLPFAELVPTLDIDAPESRASLVLRPTILSIGIMTGLAAIIALGMALRGRYSSPLLATSLIAALAVHLSLLLTALVGVGISRYTISLWPLVIPATVITALSGGKLIRERLRLWRPRPQRG